MLTILEVIQKTTAFFTAKGVESARLNAETLVGHALGLKRMQLYLSFERPLTEPELERIRPLVKRRASREPLQYILGNVEWSGMTLRCDRRALIPRPETEYLVELITARIPADFPKRILDLGTGGGALACALARAYPQARVLAVDHSDEALALARENVTALALDPQVNVEKSDWFNAIDPRARFDLIVANPPYLSESETAQTEPEVRLFEPVTALTAPKEGLGDLEKIISASPAFLQPEGRLALETGISQHALLLPLLNSAGFTACESVPDLTGRDRFLFATKAQA